MNWSPAFKAAPTPTIPPLYDHQERNVQQYLDNFGLCNFSDPGTGKTRTIIEVIRRANLSKRVLILAPKSILQAAWGNDITRFAPDLEYAVAKAENREEQFKRDVPIVITNHDAVNWLVKYPRLISGFSHMVIDESTAFKNGEARRSKSARELRGQIPNCTILTGTPTPQGILDIWHQTLLVDDGDHLGSSYYRFRNSVCDQKPRYPGATYIDWIEKEGAQDAVASILADITIRNDRRDCLDLPPNQQTTLGVKLSPKHRKLYETLKVETGLELTSGNVNAVNAVSLMAKLLQVASGAVYNTGGTVSVVDSERYELVIELANQRKHSLVAFNWRHQRDELTKRAEAAGLSYGVIDGSVSGDARTKVVEDFQRGKLRIIFAHPASAGHGLTLTRATATIWPSPTHNLEHFVQFNARIDRAGQTQRTETILIQAEDTIETEVYARLQHKDLSMNNLLGLLRQ